MPAVFQDEATSAQGTREGLGGRERNGVLSAMRDENRHSQVSQRGLEVIVAERAPDGLLDPSGHAKGGQIARTPRVGEVAGDAELEGALPVRLGIPLPKTGN